MKGCVTSFMLTEPKHLFWGEQLGDWVTTWESPSYHWFRLVYTYLLHKLVHTLIYIYYTICKMSFFCASLFRVHVYFCSAFFSMFLNSSAIQYNTWSPKVIEKCKQVRKNNWPTGTYFSFNIFFLVTFV